MPRFFALMAACFAATLAVPALAQPRPQPPKPKPAATAPGARPAASPRPGPATAKGRAATASASAAPVSAAEVRAKAMRAKILRKRVGLNEERALKVEAILERYAPERRRIQGSVREATKSLRELLYANSEDQQAYGRALEQLRAGQKALQNLRDREDEAMRQVLKPREQALLLRSLENLRRRARSTASSPAGVVGPMARR
jgi:hypothetical protein